ncbi:MAG: hypothetical protein L3J72_02980, partial [Thermoplasmata archaeon]|nr:hypothetical protein [Thermoplasmata archaeon]
MGPSRALTLVLLGASLCLSGALAPATTGRPSDAGAVPAVLLGPQPHASPCGVSDASRFPGTLTEFGTLSPVPTVAGVGVVYYYSVESDYQPSGGGNRQVSCVPADSAASTNGSGAFAIAVALPSGGCDLHGCTSYAGPFGAIRFGFSSPPPAGYFVHGNVSGGRASVAVAEAFTTLTVNPPGPVLLSVAAPGEFTAEPLAADGAPSPVLFAFAWQLATAGWSLSPTASNRTVTATAMEGAGPALLGVDVNGSFGGVPFSSALHVALLAVSTNVGSAVLLPSPADVGAPVTLSVTGAGAPGYAYWASVQPTLGVASVNTSCTAVGAPEEEVAIHCTASWTYSSTGTANPTVTVSNGYSNATRSLPSERVNPALALALAPRPLATYTDLPLPFTVSVANGTGTAPFGPACVEPGRGQRICSDAPGPSWSFALPYPMVGNYSLQTSVADAANRSGSADGIVTVAERPTLPSISIAGGPPTEGSWSVFGGQLLGGVAPVQYWWNASAPGGTFASGLVPPSGVLEASFLPAGAGSLTVTLTCLDALGSRVASEIELYVTAGPAIGLASGAGPFPSTGYAGVPVPYSFVAHAPDGERVSDFARALTLAVSGPTGAP